MFGKVHRHKILLHRVLFVIGGMLALYALFVAFVFDALHTSLIRAGQYQSYSRLYVVEGIVGGVTAGLTAGAWKKKGKDKTDD